MTDLLPRWFIRDHNNLKSPKVRASYGTLSGIVGIVVNLLLFAGKFIAGTVSGSIAISADAFNNLSDAGSSIVSLVSFRIAAKPADRDHPFGHARIEYIASMIVSFLVLLVGLIVTIGIGSSFSTIPIISTIFVPLCVRLNYTVPEVVILIASAGALGDAGAPVSDSALGPTSGLNIDGQHDHMHDTCIPTFLHYNTALFLCALLAIVFGWV